MLNSGIEKLRIKPLPKSITLKSIIKDRPCKFIHAREFISFDEEGNEYKRRDFERVDMNEKKFIHMHQNCLSIIERKKYITNEMYPFPFRRTEIYSVSYIFIM